MLLNFSNRYTFKWNKSDKVSVYLKPTEPSAGRGTPPPYSDPLLLKKYELCNKHWSNRAVTLPYLNSITTNSLQMFIDFIGKSLQFPAEILFL